MTSEKQRNFIRVDDYLPFMYRPISQEEYNLLEKKYISGTMCGIMFTSMPSSIAEIMGRSEMDQPESELFTTLIKYLYTIDMKLNHIMDLLEGKKECSLLFKEPEKINISGSGARFVAQGEFRKGDYLELRILLPGWPTTVIPALARVEHVLPVHEPGKQEIAVHYTAISEKCRDELMGYIFRMERGLLRSESERSFRQIPNE